jgi:penicillin-insensitive murein endopeptidase
VARDLFASKAAPAALPAEPIGFYTRGCLAGGVELPADGPHWQAMRPSRNRAWGTPVLVDYIQTLARDAAEKDGWPGLLVGDLAQPRGGPMRDGHASHQSGLDVDIWFEPMPARRLTTQERETRQAPSLVKPGPHMVDEARWPPALARLLRRAALDARVERIFVAPGIKKKLCASAGDDRAWLSKLRPWYGHDDHFHVRLRCPDGARCERQGGVVAGDGCGADLAWWYTKEPYAPSPTPASPKGPLRLRDLPDPCVAVLGAPALAVPPRDDSPRTELLLDEAASELSGEVQAKER